MEPYYLGNLRSPCSHRVRFPQETWYFFFGQNSFFKSECDSEPILNLMHHMFLFHLLHLLRLMQLMPYLNALLFSLFLFIIPPSLRAEYKIVEFMLNIIIPYKTLLNLGTMMHTYVSCIVALITYRKLHYCIVALLHCCMGAGLRACYTISWFWQ